MTTTGQASADPRRAVSGQILFYVAMAVTMALTAAFCLTVLASAKRTDRQLVSSVEAQMLRILQENGASGLAAAFDTARRVVLPGTDRLELALWQVRGENRRVLFETSPGVAAAFGEAGDMATHAGARFRLRDVDVAERSRTWALPMSDVALVFGFEQPSFERQRALRQVLAILGISLCACAIMVGLQVVHWQRYRRNLRRINQLLDRYSNGETGIRFEDENPAPELRELARQLNLVLPKIDGLFADLRALSAHLAHELRTPLQTIRSGLRKVVRDDDLDQRRELARSVDDCIDSADARLQTVMQLFRLQADAEVTLTPGVALGASLEDLVYDFEEDLTARDRTLSTGIDTSVHVSGNVNLLELMISNLLSNASKYAAGGSRIDVTLTADNGRFALRVVNDGQLPQELSDGAFDRYVQGVDHSGMTGYGLGLALVHAIARRHGFSASLRQGDPGADGAPRVVMAVSGPAESVP